jgi:tetratricopeptide (TPR) repeat protein
MRSKDHLIRIATVAACLALTLGLAAADEPDSTFVASISAGDSAFKAFDNVAALTFYSHAVAIDSNDCAALWKLARVCVDRATALTKDERKNLLAEGERQARRCVAMCPDSADAHIALAIVLGRLTNDAGGKKKIALSKELKFEADAALAIEPEHPGALHILGRWNYGIASLSWFERSIAKVVYGGVPAGASMDVAKSYFERAVAADPNAPLNHYWLGETLIKLDDYAGARAQLNECIVLPDVFWDDSVAKAKAEKRLKDIEGKK